MTLKRGFDPGKDLWRFPGGFVDLGESVEDAAHREAQEELETELPQTTPEATEVDTFKPDEIPWQELAFWSTTNALQDFLARS